jgi:hypothetical protein
MNTRTSLLAVAAFTALAGAALSSTSALAWGAGHFAEPNNPGPGFGGAPNPAATHPDPHVPGATIPPAGSASRPGCHAFWCSPHHFGNGSSNPPTTGSLSTPAGGGASNPPGGGASNPPGGGTSKPPGGGTWTPGPSAGGGSSPNPPGNGPSWNPGNGTGGGNGGVWGPNHRPCGYAGCGAGGWPRRVWGPNGYPTPTVYVPPPTYTVPAPTYTAPAPTYTVPAPTYTVPAPTYTTPAPTYTAPAPTYTAPAPNHTQAPAQPVGNCNCLTKSYMQDGTVVFADVCTKETAMALPASYQQGQAGYAPTPN